MSPLPRDVSTEGWRIDRILEVTNAMVLVVGALALLWLLVALVRRRAPADVSMRGESRRAILVPIGIAMAVFLIVDGYLFVRSTIDLDVLHFRADDLALDESALRVEINARRWAWDIRYAGADNRFASADDIVDTNILRVPVGRPVVIELSSSDVVHGLYIPNLRVKRDAVPGQVTRLWFQATEAGRFEIACAQHCGVHHYKMAGETRVLPAEDFDAWLQMASRDAELFAAEDDRARREEPSRSLAPEAWPEPAPTRNWGWPFAEGLE